MRRLWRRHRALTVLAQHERWRVRMGCPGVTIATPARYRDGITPRRGEVYCRCERCHAARAELGWAPLVDRQPQPLRPSSMRPEWQ